MGISFDPIAVRYDETRGGLARGETFADEIDPLLDKTSSGAVLELGVGTAVVAGAMTGRGRSVIGVDIAFEMLRRAVHRLPGKAVQYDGRRLPFASNSFSAAYAVWVFHLIDDQSPVFHEVVRVLRPGGQFLVVPTNRYPDDELWRVMSPMFRALGQDREDRDDSSQIVHGAHAVGLEEIERVPGRPFQQVTSGTEQAQRLQQREFAALWNVSEKDWERHVAPVIDRLLSMGDTRIVRQLSHELLLFRKPESKISA